MEENVEREEGEEVDTYDVPTCFAPNRMKPLVNKAIEGRINPKGIPYLYLSTKKETAMSEVRPWIGAAIALSIGVGRECLGRSTRKGAVVLAGASPRFGWQDVLGAGRREIEINERTWKHISCCSSYSVSK